MVKTLGIELCDEGTLAFGIGEGVDQIIALEEEGVFASPGFVYYDGGDFFAGLQAERRALQYPRHVSDHFWDQLSLRESGITVDGKSPLCSELAYYHLKHVRANFLAKHNPARVIFALPGNLFDGDQENEEKIGLLLGMINDLNIPLAGMVDMACASVFGQAQKIRTLAPPFIHLDIHRHAVLLSRLEWGDQLSQTGVIRSSFTGYATMMNDLVSRLANRFLGETAFDITDDAATEQQFYNQVKQLIEDLRDKSECSLAMGNVKRHRKMAVSQDEIARYLESPYASLVEFVEKNWANLESNTKGTLVLSERVSRLPGLVQKLSSGGTRNIFCLPRAAGAQGAALLAKIMPLVSNLEDTPLTSRIDLSLAAISADAATGHSSESGVSSGEAKVMPPTHIVHEGIAAGLGDSDFYIGGKIPAGEVGLSCFDNIAVDGSPDELPLCRISRDGDRRKLESLSKGVLLLNDDPLAKAQCVKAGDVLTLQNGSNSVSLMLIRCLT